jgi:hypothetical protein
MSEIEWFSEHRVHPAQEDWVSMRVASEVDAHDWADRMKNSGAIEVRVVRKEIQVVAQWWTHPILGVAALREHS